MRQPEPPARRNAILSSGGQTHAPVDSDYDPDGEDGSEYGGRGLWFMLLGVLLSIAGLGGGVFWLSRIVDRGYLDQATYVFKESSFLPDKDIKAASDDLLQIFRIRDSIALSPEPYRLRHNTQEREKAHLLIRELMAPSPDTVIYSSLPAGTVSRGFYRVGRVAYLDLSGEFLNPVEPSPRAERLAVYSLVNSIVLNLKEVDAVQILVNGSAVDTAWGWLDCSSPLGPDLSLIKS